MSKRGSISQAVSDLKEKFLGSPAGQEPVSGAQGKGTAEDPYDQGNAPESTTTGEEPPSGVQGKGTAADPYDGGNAPGEPTHAPSARSGGRVKTNHVPDASNKAAPPTITTTAAAPTPDTEPSTEETKPKASAGTDQKPAERGRDPLKAPARSRIEDRDVSPGTMPDGSHAQTSGDRGETYEPGKLSKLKSKLPFGKH